MLLFGPFPVQSHLLLAGTASNCSNLVGSTWCQIVARQNMYRESSRSYRPRCATNTPFKSSGTKSHPISTVNIMTISRPNACRPRRTREKRIRSICVNQNRRSCIVGAGRKIPTSVQIRASGKKSDPSSRIRFICGLGSKPDCPGPHLQQSDQQPSPPRRRQHRCPLPNPRRWSPGSKSCSP